MLFRSQKITELISSPHLEPNVWEALGKRKLLTNFFAESEKDPYPNNLQDLNLYIERAHLGVAVLKVLNFESKVTERVNKFLGGCC